MLYPRHDGQILGGGQLVDHEEHLNHWACHQQNHFVRFLRYILCLRCRAIPNQSQIYRVWLGQSGGHSGPADISPHFSFSQQGKNIFLAAVGSFRDWRIPIPDGFEGDFRQTNGGLNRRDTNSEEHGGAERGHP